MQIVDLRAELAEGNTSMFSRALTGALGQALEAQRQHAGRHRIESPGVPDPRDAERSARHRHDVV